MHLQYDFLVVGSGLYGATFAHEAHKCGLRCLVIEKRSHLGGNVYCEEVEGIHVHKYGAHIFHTSNESVWNFVNSIVSFNRYTNSPIANYNGELYNLPFNMNTFYQMWGVKTPREAQVIIEVQRQEALDLMRSQGHWEPTNLEEQALILVGKDIYEKLIKGYTEKQWGRSCVDLPAFIIKRLPVRLTFDNNYFNDCYQGIPIGGYNNLIQGLLSGIDTRVNSDFFENRAYWESLAHQIVYTGPIDQYYEYQFGHLQYRTVRFESEIYDVSNFQGNAVINYTGKEIPYTRIIEHKHFELFGNDINRIGKTVVTKEYSMEWQPGMEPYYPVNDTRNNEIYAKYRHLAEKEEHVIFGGRLAEYKYYDMAPVIERALNDARTFIKEK